MPPIAEYNNLTAVKRNIQESRRGAESLQRTSILLYYIMNDTAKKSWGVENRKWQRAVSKTLISSSYEVKIRKKLFKFGITRNQDLRINENKHQKKFKNLIS